MQSNQTSVRLKCLWLTMLTFAVALGLVQRAHAFTFTTINNADGFPGFMAEGINGSGEIVGSSVGDRGGQCFLRDTKGTFTALNVPDASACDATGINDLGQIVGFFSRTGTIGIPHGFLRDTKGTFTTIDVPGAISTQVFGINTMGEIAGQFLDGSGFHGFLRDTKGTIRVINIASSTSVTGINDSGEFAGTINGPTGIQGYLRDRNGTVTSFKPGGFLTQANGINNSGEIVGFFRVAIIPGLNIDQGFLLDRKGAFTTISVPGAFHTQALGINSLGKIVGAFNDSKGIHGFLATR